jgi:hypothetical protein
MPVAVDGAGLVGVARVAPTLLEPVRAGRPGVLHLRRCAGIGTWGRRADIATGANAGCRRIDRDADAIATGRALRAAVLHLRPCSRRSEDHGRSDQEGLRHDLPPKVDGHDD